MNRITGHSLDRYKKAQAIVNEGATVVAACKKARISVGQFYSIRSKLKQRRRRANGRLFVKLAPTVDEAIAQLETRRNETDAAIRVLKSL